MSYHIAIDIGASSGRLILCIYKENDIQFSEIHRFNNKIIKLEDSIHWDIDYIYNEVLNGLMKAKKMGIKKCTLGIDTWAVDYVLLDRNNEVINLPFSYRDTRTHNTIEKFSKEMELKELYEKTGIQLLNFNTLFQLYEEDANKLKKVNKILMIPDYLIYRLTNKMFLEITNASTSQLLNINTREFDKELLDLLKIDIKVFPKIIESGKYIGNLKEELSTTNLYPECKIYSVASHDTSSAIIGIPAIYDRKKWAYLSSGTRSLIGVELEEPIINEDSYKFNYTNEYGAYNTYDFLKNINGMWFIDKIKENLDYEITNDDLVSEAKKYTPFAKYIDLNSNRFQKNDGLFEEINKYLIDTGQEKIEEIGELVMTVYSSLSINYAIEISNLEKILRENIEVLHIVGGGSNIDILNQLTSDLLNIPVIAGPSEGTSVGNIICQLISVGKFKNVKSSRKYFRNTLGVREFLPKNNYDSEKIIKEYRRIVKNGGNHEFNI